MKSVGLGEPAFGTLKRCCLSVTNTESYAGDVEVVDAWQQLSENETACLIDVRTHAEWSYVGVPILDDPQREVLFVEWVSYPSMRGNDDFALRLEAELKQRLIDIGSALYFLCRSGVRSRHAAVEMTRRWEGPCYNIATGFEGDLDVAQHRASQNGWKYAGLPWRQF